MEATFVNHSHLKILTSDFFSFKLFYINILTNKHMYEKYKLEYEYQME